MSIKRYAIIRGGEITAKKVAAYLPANYRVMWQGKTDWHYNSFSNVWKQEPSIINQCVVIVGEDHHGWTLDKYVSPRLGSGMMRCDEIDLSHPIMKEIIEGGPKQPSNKLKHPISKLIEKLQQLPEGTTYEEEEPDLFGGEVSGKDLGTGYQLRINIVEGFNPPRY